MTTFINFKLNETYSLKTTDNKFEKNSLCAICFYSDNNYENEIKDDNYDSDQENELNQETVNNTLRYSQIIENTGKEICKHQLHTKCLYNWIKESKRIRCPICKKGSELTVLSIPLLIKEKPKEIKEYYDNGNLYKHYYKINDCLHGVYREYLPNNILFIIKHYDNGKLHGEYLEKHDKPNDKGKYILKCKCNYFNNNLYKRKVYYSIDGYQLLESNYNKEGNLDGIYTERYPSNVVSEPGNVMIKCRYNNGKLDGKFLCYYPDNTIKKVIYYKKGLFNGKYIHYYPDKSIRKIGYYKNDKVVGKLLCYYQKFDQNSNQILEYQVYYNNDGKKEGYEYNYDINGNIIKKQSWSNGLLNGDVREYYPDNLQLKRLEHYLNGKKHGVIINYTETGKIITAEKYQDDLLNGVKCVYYPETVIIKTRSNYKDGKLEKETIRYHKNGNKLELTTYKDGKKEGLHIDYKNNIKCNYKDNVLEGKFEKYLDNKLYISCNYNNNKLEGLFKKYDINGNVCMEVNYEGGKMNGKYYEYFPNGNIRLECEKEEGEYNGEYTQYHDNYECNKRKIFIRTNFKKGELDGEYIKMDEKGKLIEKNKYKEGKIKLKNKII